MQIVMIKSREGSPDGKSIRLYKKGETYSVPRDLSEDLAAAFVRERWARKTQTRDAEKKPSLKDSGPAAQNKDMGKAPENKKSASKLKTVRGRGK